MSLHYEGWISARSEGKDWIADDRKFLEKIGIEVGKHNPKKNRFEDCIVPASVHAQLTMLIGRFGMDLEAVKTDEPEKE